MMYIPPSTFPTTFGPRLVSEPIGASAQRGRDDVLRDLAEDLRSSHTSTALADALLKAIRTKAEGGAR